MCKELKIHAAALRGRIGSGHAEMRYGLVEWIVTGKMIFMKEAIDKRPAGQYDLSEEASRRKDDEATKEAIRQESDDVNENIQTGTVPEPEGDAENRVWTSLGED